MNGEQVTAVVDAGPGRLTTGDLYREWLVAVDEWGDAAAVERAARAKSDAAQTKCRDAEQRLGAALLADVPREMGRCRAGFVAVGGRLYYVSETGNEGDGWRYEVRQQEVRKVAV